MKKDRTQVGHRKENDTDTCGGKKGELQRNIKKHTSAQGFDAGLAFVTLGIRIAT